MALAGCDNGPQDREANLAEIPGQLSAPSRSIDGAPELSSCGRLEGDPTTARYVRTACDEVTAAFKVVQVVGTPKECVADADWRYFSGKSNQQWTACLDYNWTAKGCVDVERNPSRSGRCGDLQGAGYRPEGILVGVTSTSGCKNKGIAHPVRKFTICIVKSS
ncbi:LppU/SCO3897 family protein [Tsukamurella ocularis]|uniref:LppU/SCO3897 family protein n=1 Tax=Tsukamurella ocularis TaxID=1970234 RepID=UPI0040449B5E